VSEVIKTFTLDVNPYLYYFHDFGMVVRKLVQESLQTNNSR
jgi:hypothetical protein